MRIKPFWRDYRNGCLAAALLVISSVFVFPTREQLAPHYDLTFVIDITRSMNASDYQAAGESYSRLAYVKQQLRHLLSQLPCDAKIGLGLFTGRRATILFEPLAVCSSFHELDTIISKLDWRMAWAADSNIAQGLRNTLEMLSDSSSTLIFVTDGQEAPPLNARYQTDFSALKGKHKGLLLGVGGLKAVPIPKFDAEGKSAGFYGPEDVPHRSSFGESNLDPSQIEGYDARNAPFGRQAAIGQEHLSALQESYLQQLAQQTGMQYARLTDLAGLQQALQDPRLTQSRPVGVDVRWQAATLALILFCASYFPVNLLRR